MPLTFASPLTASQRWADPLAARLQPLIRRAVSPAPGPQLPRWGSGWGRHCTPRWTYVPVGAWTTALLLDTTSALSGQVARRGRRPRARRRDDRRRTGLPAVTGLNDMRDLIGQGRRIAMVHALLNVRRPVAERGLARLPPSGKARARARPEWPGLPDQLHGRPSGGKAQFRARDQGQPHRGARPRLSPSCPCWMWLNCGATSSAVWTSTGYRCCSPAPGPGTCARSPTPAPIWAGRSPRARARATRSPARGTAPASTFAPARSSGGPPCSSSRGSKPACRDDKIEVGFPAAAGAELPELGQPPGSRPIRADDPTSTPAPRRCARARPGSAR